MPHLKRLLPSAASLTLLFFTSTVSAQTQPNAQEPAETPEQPEIIIEQPDRVDTGMCHARANDNILNKVLVRVMPKPGNAPVVPTGPGYYSALDVITGNYRQKRPKFPYSAISLMINSFFDADFRYLADPANTQHDLFDPLHSMHLGKHWLFATGGEARWRYHSETNSRLSGRDNHYSLLRTRVFGDLNYDNRIRAFVEFLDARIFGADLPPLAVDADRTDLLNAFIDFKLWDKNGSQAWGRVGRQELLLGSQRVVSPLDWVNTRRTFEGARFMWVSEKLDLDLFWSQPVIPADGEFDQVDDDRHFAGAWLSYRPQKGQFLDLYYLFLDDDSPPILLGQDRFFNQSIHTVGFRWTKSRHGFLWDLETMLQFGDRGSESIFAGAATAGAGYHFEHLPMQPTFWVYYDYASGDQNPDGGDHFSTFNQLFPFGHYYLGWIDLVGRQNIHDINAHLFLYPTKWITVWAQYHHFELASARDALYNAAGIAIRRDPTGAAGRDVGDEIDIVINVHLGTHSDLLLGYSKLFTGSFLDRTGPGRSPEFFFGQYSFRW